MRKIVKYTGLLFASIVAAFLIFLLVLTASDYKPGKVVPLEMSGTLNSGVSPDSTYSVMSWNLGYFGLGENSDFFYDGGKMSRPERKYYQQCRDSSFAFLAAIPESDFYFFQEVDLDSRRSFGDNQFAALSAALSDHQACIAVNYKVLFVPVPVYDPHGHVNSGIATFSAHPSLESTRFAFSTGFAWPVGLFMLDRCFTLTRIRLASGYDLVLLNTHNEAFDNGSQRQQQLALLRETMTREYEKGNYVIAGGDWNLNPLGYDLASFTTGDKGRVIEPAIEADFLPGDWKWAYDPSTPSNRDVNQSYTKGTTPTTIIDFFVVSPNVAVDDVHTRNFGFKWSDHNPVTMTFRLL